MPVSIEKKAADSNTPANSIKHKSPTKVTEEEPERARILHRTSFLYGKQKQLSRGAGQLGDQR